MEDIEKMVEKNLNELVSALNDWEERVKIRKKKKRMRADEIASIRKTIVDFVHEQSTILKIMFNFKVDTEEHRQNVKSEFAHNFKTILWELKHSRV